MRDSISTSSSSSSGISSVISTSSASSSSDGNSTSVDGSSTSTDISSSTSSQQSGKLNELRTRLHSASDISVTHARSASSASSEPRSTKESSNSCGSSTDSFFLRENFLGLFLIITCLQTTNELYLNYIHNCV